jgi:hypothetical protein
MKNRHRVSQVVTKLICSRPAEILRGAPDRGEHRQAAGAVAQDLRSRDPTWRPPTHPTIGGWPWRSDGGPGQVQSDAPFS